MKPIDSTKLPATSSIHTDICIVGAGAAGLSIASQLVGAAHDVCVIESGAFGPDQDTQSLYDLESVGYPVRENFMARARYFGGTSNIWAGRAMKLSPIDFRERAWVPNSGWPIGHGDLEPYGARAEEILGLPSFARFERRLPDIPDVGEPELTLFRDGDFRPHVVTWGRRPQRFGKAFRQALSRSPNVRTYLNASVTEIVPSERGDRIESIQVATLAGNRLQVDARVYVLACGGLENARLLLVSRRGDPRGVGNRHDLVGRYFMEHPRAIFGRVRLSAPAGWSLLLGMPVADGKIQLGIGLSDEAQRRERLLNNYITLEPQLSELAQQSYQSSINVAKVLLRKGHAGSRLDVFRSDLPEIRDLVYLLTPKEIMPHFLYRGYASLKRITRKRRKLQELAVINYSEQIPRPDSRVYLSQERDRLQMNTLVLDWKVGSEETDSVLRMQALFGQWLTRQGIGTLESALPEGSQPSYTDASHHMGTTRMSDDPRRGVVDRNGRVHDVANLFVAGSSVFPTVGHANPTFTIVALALRLADHLKTLGR